MERSPSEAENMGKIYVPISLDYLDMFEDLSDENFGKLMRWCLNYYKSGDENVVELPAEISLLKKVCKVGLDKALESYEAKCSANRDNGAKGGRPRKTQVNPENPVGFEKPSQTEKTQVNPENPNKNKIENKIEKNNKEENIKEEKQASARELKTQERFNRFWALYPKKVGKQAAWKTWSKLNPSGELTEKILRAVETQKGWRQWQEENGRFIPNPTTWLNQGRWDDEETGGSMNGNHKSGNGKTAWHNIGGAEIGTGSF